MKPLILTTLFALHFAAVQAQWELHFCTADSGEVCTGKADLFIWNGEHTIVYARLSSQSGLGEGKLSFKVFEMRNDLSGEIYAEVKAPVKAGAKYASKKIYFVKPGYYKVEVYDEKLNRLASEYITITDRPE